MDHDAHTQQSAEGLSSDELRGALAQLRDQARTMERFFEKSIESLEKKLVEAGMEPLPKRKRGRPRKTDVPAFQIAGEPLQDEPQEPARPPDARERIQIALMRESLSPEQLAKVVNEPIEKIQDLIRDLRAEQKLFNVGLGEKPLWTWRIGDKTDAPTLNSLIRRLISERPMTARELADATGARMGRVNGQLVEIQRSNAKIVNMGEGHRYRWFLIGDQVKDAKLPPKYARQPKPKIGKKQA